MVDQYYSANGDVLLFGISGREIVLAFISEEALQDNADPPQTNLSQAQRIALAESNIKQLSRVVSDKLEGNKALRISVGDRLRVRIRSDELKAAKVVLSTSILSAPGFSWGAAFSLEAAR